MPFDGPFPMPPPKPPQRGPEPPLSRRDKMVAVGLALALALFALADSRVVWTLFFNRFG